MDNRKGSVINISQRENLWPTPERNYNTVREGEHENQPSGRSQLGDEERGRNSGQTKDFSKKKKK